MFAIVAVMILTSGCAGTMAAGDAGCISYSEARLDMPDTPLPGAPWGGWIADTDDRMTGHAHEQITQGRQPGA
ncbi:MAG: hypothetical protein RQ750_12265 [Roseovarius sp.]|nr:hypothetical protein [Roseovarius sp.]